MIPTLFETTEPTVQSILVTFFLFFTTVLYTYGCVMAVLRLRRGDRVKVVPADCKLSVVKPLSGVDAQLQSNLLTFALLDAPKEFEVILAVANESDPAVPHAERMVQRFPERFRLVVGANPKHFSGKIAILSVAIPHAKNDLLWLSDSNVETAQDFMHSLLATWKDANALRRVPTLVHAPLVAVDGSGSVGGALERMHLSSFQNCGYEVSLLGGVHAVIGKNLLVHKDDLALVGGIDAFGDYFGDDFMMGRAFQAAGVVRISSVPTRNVVGPTSVAEWFARHVRWAVLRKTMMPLNFFTTEPLFYPAVPMLLGLFGVVNWKLALPVVLWRVLIDVVCFTTHAKEAPRVGDVLISPFKELFIFATWITAATTRHVKWRHGSFRVGPDSAVIAKADEPNKLKRHWNSMKRALRRTRAQRRARLYRRDRM